VAARHRLEWQKCTTIGPQVISHSNSAQSGRRKLGYLLLILIAYSATVGVAHSHGRVVPQRSGVLALTGAGNSHSSETSQSSHSECPICQYQQQLFSGLVHAPFLAGTPLTETASVSPSIVSYLSTSTIPSSGRGPPQG